MVELLPRVRGVDLTSSSTIRKQKQKPNYLR